MRRRFSLVELITVMVIATILMAVSFPLFTSVMAGASVKQGATAIGSQIHLARQYAMAKRRYVALILPGPRESATGIDTGYYYSCYRLAYVDRDAGGNYTFNAWVEQTAWAYMPQGASVMEADGDQGVNQLGTSGVYTRLPADNSYTKVADVDFRDLGGNDAVDQIRAVIYSPTGKPKGDSRYVTIGEAMKTGSVWTIRNPVPAGQMDTNESCSNQITIEINRYTGGYSYRRPDEY